MKITLIKKLDNSFHICYDSDYETAKKVPVNEPIEYEWKKPRNPKFHRKFFAMLNMVFQNQEQYNNLEHLRKDLLISAGYYDVRYNFQGVEVYEAKSISFSSIDEIGFSEIYESCIDEIVKHFNFEREDIVENVLQYF